jgi:FeS assembly SUF system regulator
MLRMTRLTDYSTVILAQLAETPGEPMAATTLAERTHIAAPTVSKLLKQLQRAGLVISTRGLHGGYQLALPAREISAAAILDALEGPLALTECASSSVRCGLQHSCKVSAVWQRLNMAFRRSLDTISLAELAGLIVPEAPAQYQIVLEREMKSCVKGVPI